MVDAGDDGDVMLADDAVDDDADGPTASTATSVGMRMFKESVPSKYATCPERHASMWLRPVSNLKPHGFGRPRPSSNLKLNGSGWLRPLSMLKLNGSKRIRPFPN